MKTKAIIISLLGCVVLSIGLVTVLFAFSEDIVHRNNSFIRRYPHHPVTKMKALDIKFNSYYIAGAAGDKFFLGNVTAPLHLLSVSTSLEDTTHIRLKIDSSEKGEFQSIKVKIKEPYFYILDGTVPIILRGKIGEWIATPYMDGDAFFSLAEPMESNSFAIRARSSASNENVLGIVHIKDTIAVKLSHHLLEKQLDGIFDTDGMLSYNKDLKKLVYVYFYRNEFIVTDENLNLDFRGKTIDTVSKAQLEIAKIKSRNKSTLGSQALWVNKQSFSSGNYLFLVSDRLGKYEPEDMLKEASIIDVYNLANNTYEFSFYLYDHNLEKLNHFQVFNDVMVGILGNFLVTYKLKPEYFDLENTSIESSQDKNILRSIRVRSKT